MARTYRKTPAYRSTWSTQYDKLPPNFRSPKTQGTKRTELAANDDLRFEGYRSPNRQRVRANPTGPKIPDSYHDLHVAAVRELDYRGYMQYRRGGA